MKLQFLCVSNLSFHFFMFHPYEDIVSYFIQVHLCDAELMYYNYELLPNYNATSKSNFYPAF